MNNWCQHAIKNIGQKVLNLNDITFNNRLGNLIGRCFEMPYVSYCHPLCGSLGEIADRQKHSNLNENHFRTNLKKRAINAR